MCPNALKVPYVLILLQLFSRGSSIIVPVVQATPITRRVQVWFVMRFNQLSAAHDSVSQERMREYKRSNYRHQLESK